MKLAVIHCADGIPWHGPFADKMVEGLRRIGIRSVVTNSTQRLPEGVPILLGTSCWRAIENPPFLSVDRCSYGDTNHYVSLVWNGHGLRGDHKVPVRYDGNRFCAHPYPLLTRRQRGARVLLCGQYETYSPRWHALTDWYRSHPEATHFRPHPAGDEWTLPVCYSWDDVAQVVTLNSSVAVQSLSMGLPTVVDDEGGMAFEWERRFGTPRRLFEWLAWTQWHHKEIQDGWPIRHLFKDFA